MADRTGALVGAALVPTVVMAVDPWGWYPFGPLRWAVTTVLVAAAVTLLARPGWGPASARPPVLAGLALVGFTAVAAVAGLDPLYAWIGTPERHAGVLLWVTCTAALAIGAHLGRDRHRATLARGLVVAGGAMAAVGLAQALGWEPRILAGGDRLTGLFGSSAYLGAACALLLPVLAGLARAGLLGRAWRGAAGIEAAGLALTLLGSGARSAWLGLALAAAVAALARRRGLVAGARRHPGRTLAGTGLALAAVAVALALTPVGARIGALGDADAPGGRARLDEWRVATRVAAAHPGLGVGPEGYRIAFAEGVDATYERAHGRDPLPDRAHSAPLDVALAGGIGALAAWATWAGLVAGRAWRALRDGDAWAAGLGAALVAHLGGQLTLFPLAEVEPTAWLLAGALWVAGPDRVPAPPAGADATPADTERAGPHQEPLAAGSGEPGTGRGPAPEASPGPGSVLGHRVLRAGAAALAAVALVAGAADVAADHRARRAADGLGGPDPARAVAEAEAATRLRPDVVRLHLLLARARLAADEGTVAALAAVDDADRLSPGDPIVIRERLRLLVQRAAATEVPAHAGTARDEIDRALDRDPHNAELRLLAGEAARLDGDRAGARRARDRAEDLTGP